MNVTLFSCVLIGTVCVALGIPLALDKIRRNHFYGYRTPKSMSSPEIWSKANVYSGKAFVVSGTVTVALSLLLLMLHQRNLLLGAHFLLACILIQTVPLLVSVIFTALYVRKL